VLLHVQVLHVRYPKVVIYPFVTRQVFMGQDGHIFLLLHDSYQRPNYADPFVTRPESRARLGIYPVIQNIQPSRRFRYGYATEHKIAATERISYKH